jgi:Ca2+/Na+ antiporter
MSMTPSIPYGVGLFGMIAIGLLVAFIAAAIARPPLGKNPFHWLCAIVLLVIGVLFGARFLISYQSMRANEVRQAEAAIANDLRSLDMEMPTSAGLGESSMMIHGDPWIDAQVHQVHTTKAWGVLFVALLVPFLIFVVARLVSRAAPGEDAQRSGGGWSWLAAGAACFLFFGAYFGTARSVQVLRDGGSHVGSRGVGVSEQHAAIASAEPVDELWDRLTAARIPVSTSAVESTTTEGDDSEASHRAASAGEQEGQAHKGGDQGLEEGEPRETRLVSQEPFSVSRESDVPAPRPEWVDQGNLVVNGVRRVVIEAGPYTQRQECHDELRRKMVAAVQSHVDALVREKTADPNVYVPPTAEMGIGEGLITREFLHPDIYVEKGEASFGLTMTAWGLLEFNETADLNLWNAWKAYARRSRIKMIVLLAGLTVSAVGGVFVLLKIDTWTRGYYTKRLFLGVPAAIIGLMILAGLVGV